MQETDINLWKGQKINKRTNNWMNKRNAMMVMIKKKVKRYILTSGEI